MTVFLFLQSPYTVMMSDQLDLLALEEAGYEVKILDGTRLLLPALVGRHGKEASDSRVINLQNSSELEAIAQDMRSKDWIIFWGGYSQEQVYQSESPYRILSKSSARLGAVYASHVPIQSFSFGLKLKLKLRYAPTALVKTFFCRAFSMMVRIRPTPFSEAIPISVRPLERVWVGTKMPALAAGLMDQNTQVRRLHSVDAEALRRIGPMTKRGLGYLVFVDSMGPLHPDFILKPSNFRVSPREYFQAITKALGEISSKCGLDVVIAAHPRAEPGTLDELYSPFKVHYFKTAELIRDSFAVVDCSGSTTIGMAALLGKPITFVYSNKLQRGLLPRLQKLVATELGCPRVDLEQIAQDFVVEPPDPAKYSAYVVNYVSVQGWPISSFWGQVVRDIQA